ncbi:MAG: hypothetical protein IOC52_04120 [Methylobacterium sp.]|nr:hypothetical protein [Methylobacterium sp.]
MIDSDDQFQILPNYEAGNVWAGWIMATLAENWPIRQEIDCQDVIRKTNTKLNNWNDSINGVEHLMWWLKVEGFIRFPEFYPGLPIAHDVSITQKSLTILRQEPVALQGKNLRDALISAAGDVGKDASKELAKGQLAELFGQFVGAMFKNFSGG